MGWRDELDDLKGKASARTERDADLLRPILADLSPEEPSTERFVAAATKRGLSPRDISPPQVKTHGWLLLLSRIPMDDGGHRWLLSATFDQRKDSTINDWKMLGAFVAYLGAPKEPIEMPPDPRRPIYWQWLES